MTKRVTEYFQDPLDGEQVVETFDDPKQDESELVVDAIEPQTIMDISSQEVKACGCQNKAKESRKVFEKFIDQKIKILKKGHEGQGVSMLMGAPRIIGDAGDGHKKIKGTLAYAGVSLNNRLYLPEELAKGDGMTVPLIINHASTAGAEQEIGMNRVPQDVVKALQNGEQYEVGQVTLRWDAEMNTLFYEGHIVDEFWQQEVTDADMAVSLGMYYDSDSPQVCNTQCYTVIRGAEFHEVSLVYHPGFPIATIEAVEVKLKMMASESITKANELSFKNYIDLESMENILFEVDDIEERNKAYLERKRKEMDFPEDEMLKWVTGDSSEEALIPVHEALAKEGGGDCESCGVPWSSCTNCDTGLHEYEWEAWKEKGGDSDSCPNCTVDANEALTDDELLSHKKHKIVIKGGTNDLYCKDCDQTLVYEYESKKKLEKAVTEVDVMDPTVVDQKALEVMTQVENLNHQLKNLPK